MVKKEEEEGVEMLTDHTQLDQGPVRKRRLADCTEENEAMEIVNSNNKDISKSSINNIITTSTPPIVSIKKEEEEQCFSRNSGGPFVDQKRVKQVKVIIIFSLFVCPTYCKDVHSFYLFADIRGHS